LAAKPAEVFPLRAPKKYLEHNGPQPGIVQPDIPEARILPDAAFIFFKGD